MDATLLQGGSAHRVRRNDDNGRRTAPFGGAGQAAPGRIASIEFSRPHNGGNDLCQRAGRRARMPWWTYHAKANWDVMTYVDMVYPFFLFIVGLAIPLAIRSRLKKNPSMPALWWHVLLRSASLIVLGLILANADKVDAPAPDSAGRVGIDCVCGRRVLFWNVYGDSKRYATLFRVLRVTGLVLLVAIYAIFRRTTKAGRVGWIDGAYPEILGLIGYTYLSVAILYLLTRRWLWAPLAWFVALVALCAVSTLHWLNFPDHAAALFLAVQQWVVGVHDHGGRGTSAIFLGEHRWRTAREKICWRLR